MLNLFQHPFLDPETSSDVQPIFQKKLIKGGARKTYKFSTFFRALTAEPIPPSINSLG